MKFLKKLFEKDDWRFVGMVEAPYKHQAYAHREWEKYKLTYYLYENQHGERKIDVIDSRYDRGDLDVDKLEPNDWVFRCDQYRDTVHPWLTGFRNHDFPTYETAPQHDFKRRLEGK